MALSYDEAVKNLTAQGAPFELVTETVRGLPMRIFKNREKSMREKVANAGLRGETDVPGAGGTAHLVRRVRAPGLGDGRGAARRPRPAPRRSRRDPVVQLTRLADRALRGHLAGRDRGRPQRLVDDRGDRVRAARLGKPLPGGRRAPLPARGSAARPASPASSASSTSASHPPAGVAPIAEILRSGDAGPDRADRRGRSLRDPLHLGHHRPLEGLHHHASGHHHARSSASCSRTWWACSPAAARRCPATAARRRRCSPRLSSTSAGSIRPSAPR